MNHQDFRKLTELLVRNNNMEYTDAISGKIEVINEVSPIKNDPDPTKVVFASGASRSKLMSWYSFVPRYFIARIAKVFEYGANKYGKENWKKGNQDFIDEIPDHIIEHVYRFVEENKNGKNETLTEDHLGNIGCNLVMLMHFAEQGKFPQRSQG